MIDARIVKTELQDMQQLFETTGRGNGKLKLLAWANACCHALNLLNEQEIKIQSYKRERDAAIAQLVQINKNLSEKTDNMPKKQLKGVKKMVEFTGINGNTLYILTAHISAIQIDPNRPGTQIFIDGSDVPFIVKEDIDMVMDKITGILNY